MIVKVAAEPSYTIEKQQRIAGEGSYTTSELAGKLGQTVEYKIVVKNTGNLPLKFGALKDTGCEGLTPRGATELAVGKEESFTCTHVLAVGTYTNEASIEGNEGPAPRLEQSHRQSRSRTVLHDRKAAEHQRRSQLRHRRTDRQTRPDRRIQDHRQEHRQPAAQIRRPQRHRLRRHHPVRRHRTRRRRRRVLHLHPRARGRHHHQRSLDRRQRRHRHQELQQSHRQSRRRTVLHDRQAAATQRRSQLRARRITGKLGQTVEYKITVKNTGNLPLKFGALKDTSCEGITPSGATELAVGEEESFTCTHVPGRRHLHQRSLDRRQRRHRHQDLQQSHRQSRRRTVLHDQQAAAPQRRSQLRRQRTHRQARPDGRIQDHRQEHRQRRAQIRAP